MSEEQAAPLPGKVDPESLAIRARPPRAIRFRRGMIIGIAALGSAGLMAVSWIALKPRVFEQVAAQNDLSEPLARPTADALDRLPATYADAPKLGPPLPGDLGRPIAEHQRAIADPPGAAGPVPAIDAERSERERAAAELRSARQSALIVKTQSDVPMPVAAAATAGPAALSAGEQGATVDPARDPNGQLRKSAFVGDVDRRGDANPHRLAPAPSPYLLSAGSVIAASLITGLRSDLPGIVSAQVTEPVYDSPTGRILLIPQGARLIGSYDSIVAFGQRRALIVWQRILMPDGSSLRLDNAPASDPSGYAGLEDKVDVHSWALLKGVVLSTLLGVAPELALRGDGDLVQALRRSTQDSGARAGDQLTLRNLNVQPTITVRPGARVRLIVHRDLILAPWRGQGGRR